MLVSTETGGLGNRIKSWVSARRLNPQARVYWPKTPNMPASFAELFANECGVEALPEGAIQHASWRLAILPEDIEHLPKGFATAGGGARPIVRRVGRAWWRIRGEPDDRYRYMIAPKHFSRRNNRADGRLIDFEYGRIPNHFRAAYGPLFAQVRPRAEILVNVEAFVGEHFDGRTTGVQVRTWRDDPRRHRKHHRPALARLEKLLAGVQDDSRFFVVSDDDDVIAWLARLVGACRVLAYPRATMRRASWQSPTGMVEDLIDMLLLSHTNRIFASYLSTFSETAWWLGGARAQVSVF